MRYVESSELEIIGNHDALHCRNLDIHHIP